MPYLGIIQLQFRTIDLSTGPQYRRFHKLHIFADRLTHQPGQHLDIGLAGRYELNTALLGFQTVDFYRVQIGLVTDPVRYIRLYLSVVALQLFLI